MSKGGENETNEHVLMRECVFSKTKLYITISKNPCWSVESVPLQSISEDECFNIPFVNYRVGIPVALSTIYYRWVLDQRKHKFIDLIKKSEHVAVFCSSDQLTQVLTTWIQTDQSGRMNVIKSAGEHEIELGRNVDGGFVRHIRFTCVKSVGEIFQALPIGLRFVEVGLVNAVCPVGEPQHLLDWINKQ